MSAPTPAAQLTDSVALVTGAGSGIGEATARALCEAGARVVLSGRTRHKLESVAADLPHERVRVVPFDHRVASQVTASIKDVISFWGRLDILVNNAGAYVASTVAETSEEAWNEALDVNLTGPFLLTKAALPHLRRQAPASIVNIASTLALRPIAGAAPYCAAKAGLVMLTQATAVEEARHGVRVNVICPGVVDTPIHGQRGDNPKAVAAFLKDIGAQHPLGRIGTPREVAAAVLFLCTSSSAWTTGAVLCVDGGIALV